MAKKFNNLSIGEIDTKIYDLFPALREMTVKYNPSALKELNELFDKIRVIKDDAEKVILKEEGYLGENVILNTDLTEFNPLCKIGIKGETIPNTTIDPINLEFGFIAVKFENGAYEDILWNDLNKI